ncbi:hypothetical protein Vadar_013091 [Vaccinium darrowii]|uniref:Uncharacterized protein n=1 Tax=Vaccinium darrowii TaxID=229202 RepID=A0ACB7Z3R0_9ERIC|nr:hypothetical protein Vadar_013091 [Vaccinium darrowii]
MIMGDKDKYQLIAKVSIVHIDDVANAHIFLLEHPEARGRYICSAADITIEKMSEFLSARYPQYQIPAADCLKEVEGYRYPDFLSKKLLDIGFEYKYGLEDMYDGAIQCCKEKRGHGCHHLRRPPPPFPTNISTFQIHLCKARHWRPVARIWTSLIDMLVGDRRFKDFA